MNPVVEAYLNELAVDVAKEVLRCPNLSALHESDTELYLFLYVYFQRLAIQQRHERSIAIQKDDVKTVLSSVLAKQIPPPTTTAALSKRGPASRDVFVQQRTLRDQLTSLRINCAAFAEVIEVTRLLDQKCGVSTPFGAVQLLHFTAVFITLCSTKFLFDLIQLVVDCSALEDSDKIRIIELWAMIDSVNSEALLEVCQTMRTHPNITSPLLLELMPAVQNIHTEKYQPVPKTNAVKIVHHSAEEEAAETAIGIAPGPLVDVGGDQDEDEDPAIQQSAEDRAFWANLAK
jgi:hypothetical protein